MRAFMLVFRDINLYQIILAGCDTGHRVYINEPLSLLTLPHTEQLGFCHFPQVISKHLVFKITPFWRSEHWRTYQTTKIPITQTTVRVQFFFRNCHQRHERVQSMIKTSKIKLLTSFKSTQQSKQV